MQKEKFITIIEIFYKSTRKLFQSIQDKLYEQYGIDMQTKGIPFHITLGSYATEETDAIVSRIINVAIKTRGFDVKFIGLNHFGNVVRYMEPEISEELINLHRYFDSDYANEFDGWIPHATDYRHSDAKEIELSKQIVDKIGKLINTEIVGIELGEFFHQRKQFELCLNSD